MPRVLLCLFAITLLVPTARAAEKHTLPEAPGAIVILLDYKGGFTPPRENEDATFTIHADGKAVVGAPFGQSKKIEGKLTAEELQSLLAFILEENDFFDIATGPPIARPGLAIADAATTILRVQADGRDEGITYLGFGDDERLTKLRAITTRLQKEITRLHAGGEEQIARFTEIANEQLKKAHPEAAPLTAENLTVAQHMVDDTRRLMYQRQLPLADGTTEHVSVHFMRKPDGELMVQNVSRTVVPKRG